jgi:hypothetical protein
MNGISREAALTEAYNRGILPPDMASAYEEANRRGLLGGGGIPDDSGMEIAPQRAPGTSADTREADPIDAAIRDAREAVDSIPIRPRFDLSDRMLKAEEEKRVGTGRGLMDAWEGAKQIALRAGEKLGLVNPESRQAWEQAVEEERRLYDQGLGDSRAAGVGRIVGNAAPYAVIPGPGLGAGLGTRIVHGAATGGLVGAGQYVDENGSRLENTAIGAAAGGGMPVAIEGTSRVVGKLVNSTKGKIADPKAQDLLDLSEQHDVPLSYGDIAGGSVVPKAEAATEYMPVVGMGKFRQVQHDKAQAAAQRFMESQKPQGDDWAAIAQTSLKEQAEQVKLKASQRYDRLAKAADELGEIPTSRMNETAREIIGEELKKQPAYQDKALIAALSKYAEPPKSNFSGLRAIRSDLGDEVSDFYRGANGIVGAKGARHLQAIKSALEEDMETFATSNGSKVKLLWGSADHYYKNQVVPFKDAALAKAAKTDTPDEIYRVFIQKGKQDRAQKFFNALGPEGRQAIKYKMVEEAFTDASKGDVFSPGTFARKLHDIQSASGVFFKGQAKTELDGLTKLMRHAQRAGQYMENPPTGQRVIPYLTAGAFAIRPGEAAGAAGGVFMIKSLTTTTWGKRLLFAASRAEPGSKQMAAIIEQIEKNLPSFRCGCYQL